MIPRVTSLAAAAMLMGTSAFAAQVTVSHSMTSSGNTTAPDTQAADLAPGVEFDSVGSYFIDFEEDAEAFIMIVHDDVDETLSPLGAGISDEYRFGFAGEVSGDFDISEDGSTASLAEHVSVMVDNGEIVVVINEGAEVLAGNRIVVSFADIVGDYSDGDIQGGAASGDD